MKTKMPTIFLVEDDPFYLSILQKSVTSAKVCQVSAYTTGEDCLNNIYKQPDIVVLDQNLEGNLSGLDVLKQIKGLNPDIQVIFLSAQEKMNIAIQSLKYGAFDYVIKDEEALLQVNKLISKIIRFKNAAQRNSLVRKVKAFMLPGAAAIVGGAVVVKYFLS